MVVCFRWRRLAEKRRVWFEFYWFRVMYIENAGPGGDYIVVRRMVQRSDAVFITSRFFLLLPLSSLNHHLEKKTAKIHIKQNAKRAILIDDDAGATLALIEPTNDRLPCSIRRSSSFVFSFMHWNQIANGRFWYNNVVRRRFFENEREKRIFSAFVAF